MRDPRFEKLSGHFNQDLFEKSYAFLDDYKQSEQELLRKQIKKTKNPEHREELQQLLLKMVRMEIKRRGLGDEQYVGKYVRQGSATLITSITYLCYFQTTREASAQEAKRKQQLKRERKKAEAELVKQGKTPYFLKRCKYNRSFGIFTRFIHFFVQ